MKLTTLSVMMMVFGSVSMTARAQDSIPATPVMPIVNSSSDKTAEVQPAKDQIEAATKAFDKKNAEFMKKLRAEKDRKKMMEMYRTGRPDPSETVKLIIGLAKANPKAEGIESGLEWCVRGANLEQRKEICSILLSDHKDSKVLGKLAQSYAYSRQGGEAELREIAAKAGDLKVRQGATYYLASRLAKNADTKAEGVAMMKKLAATPGIEESNPKLLAQLKGQILVAEKLGIGCEAPDIVGTDHEDKEFKLSDYRGQVVLLDFWGIW